MMPDRGPSGAGAGATGAGWGIGVHWLPQAMDSTTDMTAQTDQQPTPKSGVSVSLDAKDDRASGWKRWLRRAALAGALISIAVHLAVMLTAYLVRVGHPGSAGQTQGGTEVEFAVMSETEFEAMMSEQPQLDASSVPDLPQPDLPDLALLDAEATQSLDQLSDNALDVPIEAGGGDISAGDDGTLGGGGGGGTSFFGLEAQGSRFAYIVDRSSSMRDGNRMDLTRGELIESINALIETGEYLVVFYSDDAYPLGGTIDWTEATDRNKSVSRQQIRQVQPSGGTQPLPAFQLVFRLRTKPDAIYFMTDGRFEEDVPNQVRQMNQKYKIPIHCVLVGDVGVNQAIRDEVASMMRRIATDSGGSFVQTGSGGVP